MAKSKIKILHVVSSLNKGGGVQSLLKDIIEEADKNEYHFSFISHAVRDREGEKFFLEAGAEIHYVTAKKKSIFKNLAEINQIIKNGQFDVVHTHQNFSNFVPIFIAMLHNVKVRISHSHGNYTSNRFWKAILHFILRIINKMFPTHFFACSIEAGDWLHGKNWLKNSKSFLFKNFVDTHKYTFNKNVRSKYRSMHKIKDEKVLLHVARFEYEKNHNFVIEMFEKLINKNPDYKLFLIGKGSLYEDINYIVEKKNLTDKVFLLGARDDVANYMSMSDVFLLPSVFEGFPVTLVEAQACGLPVLASDIITTETKLSSIIKYLPLNNLNVWLDEINNLKPSEDREQFSKLLIEKGFDKSNVVKDYLVLIKSCLKQNDVND